MKATQTTMHEGLDRAGIIASVGCAIHCLIAPFVVMFSPVIGGWWASPTVHLMIALLVLPVAALAMAKGFQLHQRTGVVVLGLVGVGLVLIGTGFPWLEPLWAGEGANALAIAPLSDEAACSDCCPTVEVDAETGGWDWKFPPASVLTMFGGFALVTAHWANLRFCKNCKRCSETRESVGPFCSNDQ